MFWKRHSMTRKSHSAPKVFCLTNEHHVENLFATSNAAAALKRANVQCEDSVYSKSFYSTIECVIVPSRENKTTIWSSATNAVITVLLKNQIIYFTKLMLQIDDVRSLMLSLSYDWIWMLLMFYSMIDETLYDFDLIYRRKNFVRVSVLHFEFFLSWQRYDYRREST